MKAKWNTRQIFDLSLILLFIYAPTLVFLPFAFSKFVLVYLIGLTFLDKKFLIQNINSFKQGHFLKFFLITSLVIVSYFLLLTIYTNNYNIVFVQQTFWLLIEGVIGSVLLYNYLINRYSKVIVLRMLLGVVTFQSVIVILTFLFPPLRDLINSFLLITDDRHVTSYRMRGLSNGGGAGLSYVQALGVLIASILIVFDKKSRSYYLLCAIIISISQIFIARTGLIFSVLVLLSVFVQESINNKSFTRLIKQLLIGVLLFFGIYNVGLYFMDAQAKIVFEERVLNRAFEFYYNYEESGNLETNSTNVLQNMYILPENDLGLLFGEGIWDSAGQNDRTLIFGRKVDSDVGFIRMIFAFGLILTIAYYIVYLIYLKDIYKSLGGHLLGIILFSLLIIFILGETKEPFLIRMSGTNKILIILYSVLTVYPKYKSYHTINR